MDLLIQNKSPGYTIVIIAFTNLLDMCKTKQKI